MAKDSRWDKADYASVNMTSDTSLPSMPWGSGDDPGAGSSSGASDNPGGGAVNVREDDFDSPSGFQRKSWRRR